MDNEMGLAASPATVGPSWCQRLINRKNLTACWQKCTNLKVLMLLTAICSAASAFGSCVAAFQKTKATYRGEIYNHQVELVAALAPSMSDLYRALARSFGSQGLEKSLTLRYAKSFEVEALKELGLSQVLLPDIAFRRLTLMIDAANSLASAPPDEAKQEGARPDHVEADRAMFVSGYIAWKRCVSPLKNGHPITTSSCGS